MSSEIRHVTRSREQPLTRLDHAPIGIAAFPVP